MSGLTLGLMSMSLVDLEVLAKSGSPKDRKHAEWLGFHSLIATSLHKQIIPQSVCSRYGLAIGAAVAPVVRVLVWICFPVAFPISKVILVWLFTAILFHLFSKIIGWSEQVIFLAACVLCDFQLLDFLLGQEHGHLFRRAELKTLINLHCNEAGKGGELTHDETTIIAGALELTEKTASDSMTPLFETFAIDIDDKLDRELMNLILEKGHSRVPVYYEQPTNIIGLILVKNLLTINPEDEVSVKSVTIRRIPRRFGEEQKGNLASRGKTLGQRRQFKRYFSIIERVLVWFVLVWFDKLLKVWEVQKGSVGSRGQNPRTKEAVQNGTFQLLGEVWFGFLSFERVLETMPLYDILNDFQKGHSHMAVVVRQSKKAVNQAASNIAADSKLNLDY
ncbi:hypothetical protein U1Q18_035227 [Sarracenia purpurea var. burkii]